MDPAVARLVEEAYACRFEVGGKRMCLEDAAAALRIAFPDCTAEQIDQGLRAAGALADEARYLANEAWRTGIDYEDIVPSLRQAFPDLSNRALQGAMATGLWETL
jgi:hypothetical protein